MSFALIVHEDPAWIGVIKGLLQQVGPFQIVTSANLAEAREQLDYYGRRNCGLIVASSGAPADSHQPNLVSGERFRATDIWVSQEHKSPPCIVLLPINTGVATADAGSNVRFLLLSDLFNELPKLVRSLIYGGEKQIQRPSHEVDVDITLINGKCLWSMRGKIEAMGSIQVNPEDLKRLVSSSGVGRHATHDYIGQLGVDMYKQFMADPLKSGLELKLTQSIQRPNILEGARFRFHVDHDTSQLLVETLAKPGNQGENAKPDFWMLSAPIFRKFGGHGERHPLFKDRVSRTSPINCLVIEGEVAGPNLPAIPMAARETDWLSSYLTENQNAFKLTAPRVLRSSNFEAGFGDAVREVLAEKCWHLVHYVGHSRLDNDGKGYLELGGRARDLLEIDEFARCARDSQFVFLNSCQSANEKFIRKLAEQNIPAVAGYAWPIDDEVAAVFARKFYTDLFEGTVSRRFLEYSFMRAKKHLHDEFKDLPVWTSPILFMQMLNPQPDFQEAHYDVH